MGKLDSKPKRLQKENGLNEISGTQGKERNVQEERRNPEKMVGKREKG